MSYMSSGFGPALAAGARAVPVSTARDGANSEELKLASATRTDPLETPPARGAGFAPPPTISRAEFLTNGRDDGFRETIYLLVQSLDRLVACREAFGRHIGLTATQFAVLIGTAYRQGDEGVTVGDLASHLALAPTHVTTEVGRLTRRGLLVKRPNRADGRSVLVSLSAAGEDAVQTVAPLVRQVNDILFEGISAADFEIVRGVAARLLTNAEFAGAVLRTTDPAVTPTR